MVTGLDEPPPLPKSHRRRQRNGCVRTLLILALVGGGLLMVAGVAFVVALDRGYFPDTVVRRGDELPERIRSRIAEVALEDGEEIVRFYSAALMDVRDDGNLLTSRAVVSWYEDAEEGLTTERVSLSEIDWIEVVFSDSFLEDTLLHVYESDEAGGGVVTLLLSAEDSNDFEFIQELVRRARLADAPLSKIEFSGVVSDAEVASVRGAVRN